MAFEEIDEGRDLQRQIRTQGIEQPRGRIESVPVTLCCGKATSRNWQAIAIPAIPGGATLSAEVAAGPRQHVHE
jgi:hypothetical protein